MNDDFAPRPKCRCAAERVITVAALLVAFVFVVVLPVTLVRDRDAAIDALTAANQTIADQQATIDQQERIIAAWVDEHPPTDGELEEGAMGARILPTIRHSAEEANGAIIEIRDLGKRISKTFDDVEAGRTGLQVKFSLMKGEAHIVLEKVP